MTHLVARTCTEIGRGPARGDPEPEPDLLSAFRSKPAYVLLGDPGMGKTNALKRECAEIGDTAHFIDARDFLTFEPSNHPEWREKTLFIDGLDEVRTGSSDARTPLDTIRSHLDLLGCPSFRISCREADWLGNNDRARLDSVAPGGEVATLRLNPLTGSDIRQVLSSHPQVESPELFIGEARHRGLEGLLANPQTLNMLADVVGGDEAWPQSKLATFEMACRQMVSEQNEEHAFGPPQLSQDLLLDAAGYLCASQLLTGATSISYGPRTGGADGVALDDCDYDESSALKPSLSTKLFKAVGEGSFVPVHRHVAEFLGARHLGRLITEGLSARRVLALISGADGVVVSEMRGVSGWLAAQCHAARNILIERDPVGVALYGDVRDFSPEEKGGLLHALGKREVLRPLWREVAWPEIEATFGGLASPDMEVAIVDVLSDSSRDTDHEALVQFLLNLLRQGAPTASLSPRLLSVIHDESWLPHVRFSALDALLAAEAEAESHVAELEDILAETHTGNIPDPDDEMRGALLARLYPQHVRPTIVWNYLTEPRNRHFIGRYSHFWNVDILRQSSDQDVVVLLDQLAECRSDIRPTLESHNADLLPLHLLARGLDAFGDDLTTDRLYGWLSRTTLSERSAAALPTWRRMDPDADDSIGRIRQWLEERPEIQKAVLLEGLRRCPDSEDFYPGAFEAWQALHHSELPPDFASWCVSQAIELEPVHTRAAEDLLWHAFRGSNEHGDGKRLLRKESVRGHPALERALSVLEEREARDESATARNGVEMKEVEEKRARARADDIAYVRANAKALRENRAPIGLLDGLGKAYFLYYRPWAKDITPVERLSVFLGGDQDLIEAALTGLRGTLWRTDLPDPDEILRLKGASRRHRLDVAFLAGLDILGREEPSQLQDLNPSQIQTGLAFYYCTAAGFTDTPVWVAGWTDLVPEVAADLAARCTLLAVRNGDGYSPALETIRGLEAYTTLQHATVLGLLGKFPPRADSKKLETLDSLLWMALAHSDRSALLDLVATRLAFKSMGVAQRVRWLAAGVIAAPETYGARLEEFVRVGQRRIRALAAFFHSRDALAPVPFPDSERRAPALEALILVLGGSFAPDDDSAGFVTLDMATAGRVRSLITQLASLAGDGALQALESLLSESELVHWRDYLEQARDDQRVVHRDAAYRYPDLRQLQRALKNLEPVNPGDLAALVLDRLSSAAVALRGDNTDGWRQYWNEDSSGRPATPKHENSCRDALLALLRLKLPAGVDAQPEGQHAGDKRSDIRVGYEGCSLPVEIKRDKNPDLWSALRTQLIGQYTRDIETGGYGIYLVFWFGQGEMPPPPRGTRPTTAGDMRKRLEESLTVEEARKVSVIVVDVSPVR